MDPILGKGGGNNPNVGILEATLCGTLVVRGNRDAAVIRGRFGASCDIFEKGLRTLMGFLGCDRRENDSTTNSTRVLNKYAAQVSIGNSSVRSTAIKC